MLSSDISLPSENSVARGAFDAHHGDDVAGRGRVDIFLLVGVDAEDPADPGPLLLPGVVVEGPLLEGPLVDPDEGDLAEGLLDQLERHRHQRRVRVGSQRDLGAAVAVILGEDLAVERAGQVAVDGVEQGLDALVAIGRADHHRADLLDDRPLADRLVDQLERDLLLLQQQGHDLVGEHRQRLEHPLAGALGGLGELGRDRLDADVLALLAVEVDRLAVDQVDHAGEARLEPHRDLQRDGRQAQLALELLDHVGRVGPRAVHLVDERDPRHRIALHLPVHGDRLRLHAGHRAEHQHGAVEHAERALDLDREIHVARGVDDVDLVIFPLDGGGRRGDRDALLALELHVVHHRAFTLDLLDHVGAAGVEQDALGQRGLARVDVGRDADVAYVAKVFHGRVFYPAVILRVERPRTGLQTHVHIKESGLDQPAVPTRAERHAGGGLRMHTKTDSNRD